MKSVYIQFTKYNKLYIKNVYIHLYYLTEAASSKNSRLYTPSCFSRNIKSSFTFTRCTFEESVIAKVSIQ